MKFEPNQIYHVYNQGNNKQKIFFTPQNYHYFIGKMKKYLLPNAELLCFCLMPNHFHWLLYPNESGCHFKETKSPQKQQNLSYSIGILLSSYTKAINNQEKRTGSLFRQNTKSKNGWINEFRTRKGEKEEFSFLPTSPYPKKCFEYIHQNPVKAELVKTAEHWEFSSANDYYEKNKNSICNLKLAKDLQLWP